MKEFMWNVGKLALEKLKERSTWYGLLSLAASLGLVISPAMSESIVAVGLAVVGLIGIIMSDKKSE